MSVVPMAPQASDESKCAGMTRTREAIARGTPPVSLNLLGGDKRRHQLRWRQYLREDQGKGSADGELVDVLWVKGSARTWAR